MKKKIAISLIVAFIVFGVITFILTKITTYLFGRKVCNTY